MWNPKKFRQARLIVDMTQEQAATAVGYTRQHITKVETGHHYPSEKLVAALAKLYEQPISFFLAAEVVNEVVAE